MVGKPLSSPEAIDAAVAKAHEHGNKEVLDEIAENADRLHFKGEPVSTVRYRGGTWDL